MLVSVSSTAASAVAAFSRQEVEGQQIGLARCVGGVRNNRSRGKFAALASSLVTLPTSLVNDVVTL